METLHIALKAETVGHIFGMPITNTLITSIVAALVLILIAIFVRARISLIPGKVQLVFEMLVGGVLSYMEEVLGDARLARRFFPLIATIFLFIAIANILEFLPGVGSVGFYGGEGGRSEFVPLFRSVNTDLNMTLALSLISFFVIEFAGVAALGFLKYGGKFVTFKSPLAFFIGLIELLSEVARLISFSFRLFGNIFAGEVLITVAAFFVPLFLPVPLMLFEMFVGLIQAAIFALLTLFFIKIAIMEPEGH
ncbi:MAG: F0F1 ATP synthase subunit A [Patescibacteria group bacterium]